VRASVSRAWDSGHGDVVAFCLENRAEFFDLVWGAQRAGLIYVAISCRLTPSEMDYILTDSGAKALFASPYLGATLGSTAQPSEAVHLGRRTCRVGIASKRQSRNLPTTPIADERAGTDMLYSSGTTGQPKGVRFPLPEDPDIAGRPMRCLVSPHDGVQVFRRQHLSVTSAALPRCAACAGVSPWCTGLGGTVVVMEKFDPEAGVGRDRKIQDQRQPVGPNAFRANAEAAGGCSYPNTTCRVSKPPYTPLPPVLSQSSRR
jgi:long-chain acyl-CoA synthetase